MDKRQLNQLMTNIRDGDNSSFEKLYNEMKRGIFAFAYTYVSNEADAEDILEETFLQVKRKAYTYSLGTDVRAWIFQITKNLCLDLFRKRKKESNYKVELKEDISTEQRFPLLDDMTRCLNDEEREIVILHAVWEYKHKEIAEMKNIPLGTVTWKYNQAIEKLRKSQKEEEL